MARLNSVADLRRIIAEPRPATFKKILDALDEQSIEIPQALPVRADQHDDRGRHHRGLAQGRRAGLHPRRGSADAADPRADRQQPRLRPVEHRRDRQDRHDRPGAGDRRDAAHLRHGGGVRRSGAGAIAVVARQAGAAGDAGAHQALLLPLRPLDPARQSLEARGLAGARSHLLRQDHRPARRRGCGRSRTGSMPAWPAPTRTGSGATARPTTSRRSRRRGCRRSRPAGTAARWPTKARNRSVPPSMIASAPRAISSRPAVKKIWRCASVTLPMPAIAE